MVVPSNLDDRQILFSNEEDDAASHTASKNAIPSCAAEWHFLDLVEVLVEAVNFTELWWKIKSPKSSITSGEMSGGSSGVRTPDTLIKSQVLYQLS